MRHPMRLLLFMIMLLTGCDALPRLALTDEALCMINDDFDCDKIRACSAVANAPGCDCDDKNPSVYPASSHRPAAEELCDNLDNDCSGAKNDDMSLPIHYPDNDLDGYGDERFPKGCVGVLVGHVLIGGDCQDSPEVNQANKIHAGAYEYCNNVDDNCNGTVDGDGELHYALWYPDADGDGYGDDAYELRGESSCRPILLKNGHPYSQNALDCDDGNSEVNPRQTEIPDDDIDNNCDDISINSSDLEQGWDLDRDGYDYETDCNEQDGSINPGATERCDGKDNNCDGQVDNVQNIPLYPDLDRDGYGDGRLSSIPSSTCDMDGYAAIDDEQKSDCNDADSSIHPGQPDGCNGVDDDCDGTVDDDPDLTFYKDDDGDGHGDENSPTQACERPEDYVSSSDDCNDGDDTIHPNASESCLGIDSNCNKLKNTDDPAVTDTTCGLPYDVYVDDSEVPIPPCACMTAYSSIRDAIVEAKDTMVIGIAAGTYHEQVSLMGKAITLQGLDGPELTIIDAQQNGSGLTFNNNEAATTRVENLTITGGKNSYGGGIYIEGASPTLTGLWIIGNVATNAGGGVGVIGGQPSMDQVVIDGNSALSGAGLYVTEHASLQLKHGLILRNTASQDGGGVYVSGGSVLSLTNVLVVQNSAFLCENEHRGYGGGLYVKGLSCLLATQSTFAANTACTGGGVAIDGSLMALESSLIASNGAEDEPNLSTGKTEQTEQTAQLYLRTSLMWLNELTDLTTAAEAAGSTVATWCPKVNGSHCIYESGSYVFDWWIVSPQFTEGSPYLLQTSVSELEPDNVIPGGYGGSGGSTWDLDQDGVKAWYQTTAQWPPPENPEGWDLCDYAGFECEE